MKYILYTDGAARGNPGPGGAGAYLVSESGKEIARLRKYLGEVTNNVAEYQALLLGLTYAKKESLKVLTIYADSELLVNQVNGIYKVRNKGLNILYEKVMKLLDLFDYRIVHIRREKNEVADQLANEAIDNELGGKG